MQCWLLPDKQGTALGAHPQWLWRLRLYAWQVLADALQVCRPHLHRLPAELFLERGAALQARWSCKLSRICFLGMPACW